MATMHATLAALRTLVEGVTPLTDAGRRFVVAQTTLTDAPSYSREVVILCDGVVAVTHYLSASTWHVAHDLRLVVRYACTDLRPADLAQAVEDTAILLGAVMRPTQLTTVPWHSVSLVDHRIEAPGDESPWLVSVIGLRIMQEVS